MSKSSQQHENLPLVTSNFHWYLNPFVISYWETMILRERPQTLDHTSLLLSLTRKCDVFYSITFYLQWAEHWNAWKFLHDWQIIEHLLLITLNWTTATDSSTNPNYRLETTRMWTPLGTCYFKNNPRCDPQYTPHAKINWF